jgi:hypothetical protein
MTTPEGSIRRKAYTREEITQLLREFAERNGRWPIAKDYDLDPELPCKRTMMRLVGSASVSATAAYAGASPDGLNRHRRKES